MAFNHRDGAFEGEQKAAWLTPWFSAPSCSARYSTLALCSSQRLAPAETRNELSVMPPSLTPLVYCVCVADVITTLGIGTHEPSPSGVPLLKTSVHGAAAIACITAELLDTSANTA